MHFFGVVESGRAGGQDGTHQAGRVRDSSRAAGAVSGGEAVHDVGRAIVDHFDASRGPDGVLRDSAGDQERRECDGLESSSGDVAGLGGGGGGGGGKKERRGRKNTPHPPPRTGG